ncbi:MAG: methionine--tRNA ligase [Rhodobiaceae bacterium]|nr:methionine--tRNA ligase [Rhodobiaceae bacterium]|tara:strand:+ start:408 stop:1940 length:1533 start_codon:yes stop_codon:yes gene_type:complete
MSKNFYISTAIFYTNGSPHIGHAYEMVAADVIARFKRLDGFNVFFLTGTDEHGLKVQKKADELNIKPLEFVNKISKEFLNLSSLLNCSNDDFIRTTEERHKINVNALWKVLDKNGDIYLDEYSGWYSIRDEAFYTEDELLKDENGDYISPEGNSVEWINEESYFFRLSKYEKDLLDLYKKNKDFIKPESRMNEIKNFVSSGLKDISISRKNIKWGIPVSNNVSHIIYVWFDALINYLSALGWAQNDNSFKSFWPANIHLVGKDITRFHAVYWPAFLLSAGIKIPETIFSHGFFLNKGEKISKSLGNTIDPIELCDFYGVDQLRYYMLSTTPFGNDGIYDHELITKHVNAHLSNDLGNLSQRCLTMIKDKCGSKIPDKGKLEERDLIILGSIKGLYKESKEYMEDYQIHNYLDLVFKSISLTNKYFSDEKPWELAKNDVDRMNTVLWVTCEMLRNFGIILQPVLVDGSKKLLGLLNIKTQERQFSNLGDDFAIKIGTKIPDPEVIFPKLNL